MPTPATGPRHILSADQFTPDLVRVLFAHADQIQYNLEHHQPHRHPERDSPAGHILYRLFYKESTRTYESFGFAATHLGMPVLGTQSVQFTSVSKGESLEDTIRTINCYGPSSIVLRSANAGEAAQAAVVSDAPIINAGDGSGEHPTQALLDLYTIQQEIGRLQGLHVVFGIDPNQSRTIRSLALVLTKFPGNHFTFVSPPNFELQSDIKSTLDKAGVKYEETSEPLAAFKTADIVYWNRFQAERHTDLQKKYLAAHPGTIDKYIIGLKEIAALPAHARLLDPFPRIGEIKTEVDTAPSAAYIRQMHYGMVTRMALIEWVLGYLD